MSINLKIGFNNNLIANSSYSKHMRLKQCIVHCLVIIDLLMKKLIMSCYAIRNVKTHVCLGIKNNLSYFFSLRYEYVNYILGKLIT